MKSWTTKQLQAWIAKHKEYNIPDNFSGNVFDLIALDALNLEQLTDLIFRNEVLDLKEVNYFLSLYIPKHSKKDSAQRARKWSEHRRLRTRAQNTLKSLSFYFQECGLAKELTEAKLKYDLQDFLIHHKDIIK